MSVNKNPKTRELSRSAETSFFSDDLSSLKNPRQNDSRNNNKSTGKKKSSNLKFNDDETSAEFREDDRPQARDFRDGTAQDKNAPRGGRHVPQPQSSQLMPQSSISPKVGKLEHRAEKTSEKLNKAKDKLPAKRKIRVERSIDEFLGKTQSQLKIEKTVKSQKQHIKGSVPLRPVKLTANAAIAKAHIKIFQVEDENVAVKASHRAEMIGEATVRSALRHRKLSPYKKVVKLEHKQSVRSAKLAYTRAIEANPNIKRNPIAGQWQKRKFKKMYAKQARAAQKNTKKSAKKSASLTGRAARGLKNIFKKNPKFWLIVIAAGLIFNTFASCFSAISGVGGGTAGVMFLASYQAEDEDILAAQEAYADMEAELQFLLDNFQTLRPDYDEYVFILDEIWHDPYSLISILSAFHEGAWTLPQVLPTLNMLFERQYILTETVTVEVRFRTETSTSIDPQTGEEYEVIEVVAYNYYIITVKLENFNLSKLPIHIMSVEQLSNYALFMWTLGNRPDLFPTAQFPRASHLREPGLHDINPEYLAENPVFAAMMSEAVKYVGMPYIWGGFKPEVSFDCSGFVSWVLNQSGWDIGRLSAQGLYNISEPVSPENARPGDLVFFSGTYAADYTITHVGIYVGDNMMIHAGNPIGFALINSPYAYGRP